MARVSIIVPVYNAEMYVAECIESIQKQTLTDIEIIIVNDGSTDSSGLIANEFAEHDKRIKVLHQKNKGLVETRKRGILEASSDYIGFVDADDWIEPDMYGMMFQEIKQNGADLVLTEIFHYGAGGEYAVKHTVESGLYDYNKIVEEIYPRLVNNGNGLHPSMGTKLFRKALLESVMDYVDGRVKIAEDVLFSYPYMIRCKKIYVMDKAFYHYRFNPDSMCHRKNYNILSETELVINKLRESYRGDKQEKVLMESLNQVIYWSLLFSYKFHATGELGLFYLFPYSVIPKGSKIVLYGAGNVGKAYYKQLRFNGFCQIVLWVDGNYKKIGMDEVTSPERIETVAFDYIVIAAAENTFAKQIQSYLQDRVNIRKEKIVYQKPLEGMEILQRNV